MNTGVKVGSMEFVCDKYRHLVCLPFSVANLHLMANALKINRCWFHASKDHPHYDIPKTRIEEIQAKCRVTTQAEILTICRKGS